MKHGIKKFENEMPVFEICEMLELDCVLDILFVGFTFSW